MNICSFNNDFPYTNKIRGEGPCFHVFLCNWDITSINTYLQL